MSTSKDEEAKQGTAETNKSQESITFRVEAPDILEHSSDSDSEPPVPMTQRRYPRRTKVFRSLSSFLQKAFVMLPNTEAFTQLKTKWAEGEAVRSLTTKDDHSMKKVALRLGEKMVRNADKYAVRASLVHSLGDSNINMCGQCATDHQKPPFTLCVSMEGFFGGACTNCEFNHEGTHCTVKTNGIPRDLALRRGSKENQKNLLAYVINNADTFRSDWVASVGDTTVILLIEHVLYRVSPSFAGNGVDHLIHAKIMEAFIPTAHEEFQQEKYADSGLKSLQDSDLVRNLKELVMEERGTILEWLKSHPVYVYMNDKTRLQAEEDLKVFFDERFGIAIKNIAKTSSAAAEHDGELESVADMND